MDISKIESGHVEIFLSEININDEFKNCYDFFKPEVDEKGINFNYKTSLNPFEANIKTDSDKVNAVLINLIKNAIKFTPSGSIEFGCEKKNSHLEFYVKDTGIGIPKEKKDIIFERFRQGNESHSRNVEGTGLGLAISKAFVEMLGGIIWVQSEEGKGSTFCFTLPTH
jgi:signal transduction histidine kinase